MMTYTLIGGPLDGETIVRDSHLEIRVYRLPDKGGNTHVYAADAKNKTRLVHQGQTPKGKDKKHAND